MQKISVLINERDFARMLIDPASTSRWSGRKEETMSTEQEQWAVQIHEVPTVFRMALLSDGHAIRHHPAAGERSAVEVVGHMIDKMWIWTGRVERLMVEERPALPAY